MKRFKLGLGNRPISEQINICQRVAQGIGKLPTEQRQKFARLPVADSVTAAVDAVTEVELLKANLRTALAKRDEKTATMRVLTTAAAQLINMQTEGNPAALRAWASKSRNSRWAHRVRRHCCASSAPNPKAR